MFHVSMSDAARIDQRPETETLTDQERARLARIDVMREYFTDQERARLAFVRWLVATGKVTR